MHRRLAFQASLVLAVLIVLVPQVGSAGQGGPPYTSSHSNAECGDVLQGGGTLITCSATAAADHLTGALGLDLRTASPLEGTLPGLGRAYGYGEIIGLTELKKEASAAVILVTVHVNSAEAVVEDLAGGADAYAYLFVWANPAYCSCGYGTGRSLVDSSYGPSSRANEDIVVPLVITNYEGGPVPAGTIRVSVEVGGSSFMADAGTARVFIDAQVTDIEIA
jgi:hypothetical protein